MLLIKTFFIVIYIIETLKGRASLCSQTSLGESGSSARSLPSDDISSKQKPKDMSFHLVKDSELLVPYFKRDLSEDCPSRWISPSHKGLPELVL